MLRNVALVSAATQIEAAVGLVAGVLIARGLGPHDFGLYAYAVWLCGWMMLASNHALTTSSIKFIAEAMGAGQPAVAAAIAARARRLQVLSSCVVLGGFVVVAWLWPPDDWRAALPLYLAIAVVAVWARAGFWALGAIAKGYERFEPENAGLVLTSAFYLAAVAAVWAMGGGVVLYFAAYALAGLVSNAIVRHWIRQGGIEIRPGPIPDDVRARFNRHLMLTGVIIVVSLIGYRTFEIAFLKISATAADVGFFAIAATLTRGAVGFLGSGLSAVVLPGMARSFGRGGQDSLRAHFSEAARVYWLAGMAIGGGGAVVADGLIRLLYGHRYEGAIVAVVWSLVLAGFTLIGSATTALMVAGDRQGDRIKVNVAGLFISLVAAAALVPPYGLVGALVSLTLHEVLGHAMVYGYARRHFGARLPLSMMWRSSLATAVAVAVGLSVRAHVPHALGFVPAGIAFCVVFGVLLVLLRTFRARDYDAIRGLARRGGAARAWLGAWVDRLERRFAGTA
jgi:O-antigen/teichoic acid export membrane protein